MHQQLKVWQCSVPVPECPRCIASQQIGIQGCMGQPSPQPSLEPGQQYSLKDHTACNSYSSGNHKTCSACKNGFKNQTGSSRWVFGAAWDSPSCSTSLEEEQQPAGEEEQQPAGEEERQPAGEEERQPAGKKSDSLQGKKSDRLQGKKSDRLQGKKSNSLHGITQRSMCRRAAAPVKSRPLRRSSTLLACELANTTSFANCCTLVLLLCQSVVTSHMRMRLQNQIRL